MTDQHRILCTRRMPPNVEARLARDYEATLNPKTASTARKASWRPARARTESSAPAATR